MQSGIKSLHPVKKLIPLIIFVFEGYDMRITKAILRWPIQNALWIDN